ILKNEQKPVLIYFYYKSYDHSPKYMLPALDRINSFIGHRLPIYRYRFQKYDDSIKSKFGKTGGTFVVFDKGEPVKSMSTSTFFKVKDPANSGQIFLFIKDVLDLRELNRFEATKLEYLDGESFYKKVIDSPNPVVVNFTSSSCPAANRFRGFYKNMADSYGSYADFYYVDTSKEKEIVGLFGAWATPTVIIYNNGGVVSKYKGAYSDQYANDSRLFGYLFTLLVDDIML
ncbi:MAG: thioredoxin family protein, partial [Candidatus Omnitrophica bacterium]|nr:thioredoxin family protein [Candidatus Omnitrophota bacterium]